MVSAFHELQFLRDGVKLLFCSSLTSRRPVPLRQFDLSSDAAFYSECGDYCRLEIPKVPCPYNPAASPDTWWHGRCWYSPCCSPPAARSPMCNLPPSQASWFFPWSASRVYRRTISLALPAPPLTALELSYNWLSALLQGGVRWPHRPEGGRLNHNQLGTLPKEVFAGLN